jgi:hypothetical protein
MAVHTSFARRRFFLLGRIPFAVPAEGPSPARGHHHRLQVILAREALRRRCGQEVFSVYAPTQQNGGFMPDPWLIVVSGVCVLGLALTWRVWWLSPPDWNRRVSMRRRRTNWPLITQVLLSSVLLAVGLSVILSKQYDAADTNWAYGIVGTVVGYWLKGK